MDIPARKQAWPGIYENGFGVPKDYKQAFQWYQKASDNGLSLAQNILGNYYADGKVGAPDYTLAIKWYTKAADQGLRWQRPT